MSASPIMRFSVEASDRLAKRIRFLAEQQGITLTTLGERCGMVQPTISKLVSGKVDPRLSTLQAVAEALDVPLQALFDA